MVVEVGCGQVERMCIGVMKHSLGEVLTVEYSGYDKSDLVIIPSQGKKY